MRRRVRMLRALSLTMLVLVSLVLLRSASAGLVAEGPTLTLDGRPYQIFSGALHYFRVHPDYWDDRLLKLKAAGLNTVETYAPWNLHEPSPGVFDFAGGLDVVKFITKAGSHGLKVIFRPGPYICAEWEWGGHPYWLLNDPNMRVRTMYPGYTEAASRYLGKILGLVSGLQWSAGGPIVAVQVENEYGAYGSDAAYIAWTRQQLLHNGVTELLFTSDGPPWLRNGTIPGLFTVVNFQDEPEESLAALRAFQPDRPLMVGEFWSGWFDHWGQDHHIWSLHRFTNNLKVILAHNASFNLYMFHGGTNFGFMNGANRNYTVHQPVLAGRAGYQPTVTSYDYDAPLTEAGWTTAKYFEIQALMRKHNPEFTLTPELEALALEARAPELREPEELGPISERGLPLVPGESLSLSDALRSVVPRRVDALTTMEALGQAYGFVAYRLQQLLPAGPLHFHIACADRCHVIVNGRTQKIIYNTYAEAASSSFSLELVESANDVVILAENMGRVNYDMAPKTLDAERKGVTGYLATASQAPLIGFLVYSLPLDGAQMEALGRSQLWRPLGGGGAPAQTEPTLYRLPLPASAFPSYVAQTPYLDLQAWSKGQAFLNGFNLGRYWTPMGPSTTLYFPPSEVKISGNQVTLFELDEAGDAVALVAVPNYGRSCDMPCYWNMDIPA